MVRLHDQVRNEPTVRSSGKKKCYVTRTRALIYAEKGTSGGGSKACEIERYKA